ncbi:MAG: cytochrome c [Candidatus Thiothrix singaporensis]|uniref:Cytochrome c n=1 Tax=Candidatus Thiothrix singaporensis TaxID=2799669 RepID=A0A7L6AMS0_9GAMM|nr:MAG: cytochrome c [Candidatus Thiothrix singaporensis]
MRRNQNRYGCGARGAGTENRAQCAAAGDRQQRIVWPGLHDANCISCHDSGVYTRADHKMQDYAMLSAQVRRCDANLGARLFDEDLDKVTDYLNDTYYHFAKP